MADILKICGVVAAALVSSLVMKRFGNNAVVCVGAASMVILFLIAAPRIGEIVDYASSLEGEYNASEFFPIVLKVSAAALISEALYEIASSCGEEGLARGVTLFCKIEIVCLSLPIVKRLFELAASFTDVL